MPHTRRRRISFIALVGLVIASGLASRTYSNVFPDAIRKYPGDALWSLMVMLAIGVLFPYSSTRKAALIALAVAFGVEFSQLIRWPWLVALRQNPAGHLVLGSGFHLPDLLAYTVGVSFGAFLESSLKAIRPVAPKFFAHVTTEKAAQSGPRD